MNMKTIYCSHKKELSPRKTQQTNPLFFAVIRFSPISPQKRGEEQAKVCLWQKRMMFVCCVFFMIVGVLSQRRLFIKKMKL